MSSTIGKKLFSIFLETALSANENKDVKQIEVKGGSILVLLKGLVLQIIPFMSIIVLFRAIHYIRRKKVPILGLIPNKVSDKRYGVGYRIEGYRVGETDKSRDLTEYEIVLSKQRGYYYLSSVVLFVCLYSIYHLIK